MDPWQYWLFLLLFILSGFFSGSEIALMSLPKHKIDALLKQKKFGSWALHQIRQNTDRLLITILVWNNLVNVYTAALATQISLSIASSSGMEASLAVGLATGVITFLILVFGEIVPKSFSTKNAEKIGLFVAPMYFYLMILLSPVIFVLEKLILIFTWKNSSISVTEEEIESFIDLGKDAGTLEEEEHELLKNSLEFHDTLVEEIMIPRVRIVAMSDEMTLWEALEFYMQENHSRIPVYHQQIDTIIAVVSIRWLLEQKKQWKTRKKLKDVSLPEMLQVPINQPLDVLLESFKTTRQHMAIVKDEYGWVAWLVTIEDVIEEIFGEIHDETDKWIDEIIEKKEGVLSVDPGVQFADVLEEFDLEFSDIGLEEKEFGGDSLAYMITHKLERFPKKGEKVYFDIVNGDAEDVTKKQLCCCIHEMTKESVIWRVEVSLE